MVLKQIQITLLLILLPFVLFSSDTISNTSITRLNKLLEEAENYRVKSFEKCLEYATEAQKLAEALNKPAKLAKATKTIGIAYYFKGDYNNALKYYVDARTIYDEIGDQIGVAKIYNNIGIIYQRWSQFDNAMDHYYKSLAIYEEMNDSTGMAGTLNNIANIKMRLQNYDEAIAIFEDIYDIFEKYNVKREMANSLNNIGYGFEQKLDYDKALNYYIDALKIRKEIIDNYGIGVSQHNIGCIYRNKKDYTKAREYLFKALNTRKELGHLDGITSTTILIGEVYSLTHKPDLALEYFYEALRLANRGELNNRKLDIYFDMYETYYNMGSYKKAIAYLNNYINLKDSIFNENKLAQINEIEARYEKEKDEKEIELLKIESQLQENEIKKQKLIRNIFVLSIFFIIIIGILLLTRYLLILKNKKILEEQNNMIRDQHDKIAEINKNMTDSILYSKKLLSSILPQKDYIHSIFKEFFILNKPKDIVSGDFYWVKKNRKKVIMAVADCTGHGVPGAIMSMLGISFLNEIVGEKTNLKAGVILDELREKVIETLHQTGKKKESKDGIDISLCILDKETLDLQFSGAFNNAYIIHNQELVELKGDKKPIGIYVTEHESFQTHTLRLRSNTNIYLSTDGYFHQFGGDNNTKFGTGAFKDLLQKVSNKEFSIQREMLENTIDEWMGTNEQVDDIMVLGIKI